MIFSRSSRRPTREFSLAELVAKISELEQRQRNALPSGNAPDYLHAFMKGGNGKDMGLWLNGKFNRPPQHIYAILQQQGRA